jgi:hypothetical protein
MGINLKKKGGGLKLVKEIVAKALTRQKEIENLNKLKNPFTKKPNEKNTD